MESDGHNLPNDPAALQRMVAGLLEKLESQEQRLRHMQHWLEQLWRQRYGHKSERLEYVPASLEVIEEVCQKYACPKGCTVVTAEKPVAPIDKGLPGPGLLAHVHLLYEVEHEAHDQSLKADERRALRQTKSKPILADIKAYLERERPKVLPKSPEGQAISYTLSNWAALERYSEDGDLEIDNNGAERSLRGMAVGRKNWMFVGSDNGGRAAALLTSLVATCKRHHMDPFAYLCDVFERIDAHPKNRIEESLPDQWLAARSATTA